MKTYTTHHMATEIAERDGAAVMDQQEREFETRLALERLKAIDRLSPLCAWNLHTCQCNSKQLAARSRYQKLIDDQLDYEQRMGF